MTHNFCTLLYVPMKQQKRSDDRICKNDDSRPLAEGTTMNTSIARRVTARPKRKASQVMYHQQDMTRRDPLSDFFVTSILVLRVLCRWFLTALRQRFTRPTSSFWASPQIKSKWMALRRSLANHPADRATSTTYAAHAPFVQAYRDGTISRLEADVLSVLAITEQKEGHHDH